MTILKRIPSRFHEHSIQARRADPPLAPPLTSGGLCPLCCVSHLGELFRVHHKKIEILELNNIIIACFPKLEFNPAVFMNADITLIHSRVSEVIEEMLKRMQSHPGVIGTVIINKEGQVVKSTLDNSTSLLYATLATRVCDSSLGALRDIDATNDLTFLRVRSKKNEIMIAPDKDFVMVTIRATTDST